MRVVDGAVKKGDRVLMMATGTEVLVEEVGARRPAETPLPELSVGEVGYLVTGLKDVRQVKVGDTITAVRGGVDEPLPGYRDAKPMVFTGLFPVDANQYEALNDALKKLPLNDAALAFEPESRPRSASASAPASSASCTWTSSRSALNANTTWTSSRRPRPWCTRFCSRTAR